MRKYDDIKHLRISELASEDVNYWLIDEITSLTNDFGNSINTDQIIHIGKRMFEKLTTAYRSWYVADVHAAFQTGLSGAYGKFSKVTVVSLFIFLKMAQNQMSVARALAAENEKKTDVFDTDKYNTPVSEFLVWARTRLEIDVNNFHPEHDPFQSKQVSPVVLKLTDQYILAKETDCLIDFASELRKKYAYETV